MVFLWPVFCVVTVTSLSLTFTSSMRDIQAHKPWQVYAILQLHSLFKNLYEGSY